MRTLAISLLALVACACATTPGPDPIMTAERSATLARASHALACQTVIEAHAAGQLVGAGFNAAKANCLQVDALLDAGDALIAAAKIAEAQGSPALADQKALAAVTAIRQAADQTPKE